MDQLHNFIERRHNQTYGKEHGHNDSSTTATSIHSGSNHASSIFMSNRSSIHTPNAESQLNSLLVDVNDSQENTAELLNQTFDQMDLDNNHNVFQYDANQFINSQIVNSYTANGNSLPATNKIHAENNNNKEIFIEGSVDCEEENNVS